MITSGGKAMGQAMIRKQPMSQSTRPVPMSKVMNRQPSRPLEQPLNRQIANKPMSRPLTQQARPLTQSVSMPKYKSMPKQLNTQQSIPKPLRRKPSTMKFI